MIKNSTLMSQALLSFVFSKHGFSLVTKEWSDLTSLQISASNPSVLWKQDVPLFTRDHRAPAFSCRHRVPEWNGSTSPRSCLPCVSDVPFHFPFQLSQGSPEPIEPNFFTSDYHLLHHSLAANNWSQSDPTGKGGSGFHQK